MCEKHKKKEEKEEISRQCLVITNLFKIICVEITKYCVNLALVK